MISKTVHQVWYIFISPATLREKPWDKSKLRNTYVTFPYGFFSNAISIPFVLSPATVMHVFYCAQVPTQFWMYRTKLVLSVQNCNCTFLINARIKKSLEKHKAHKHCITVVIQTQISASLHKVHLTNQFHAEDDPVLTKMSKVRYWSAFQV